MYTVYCCLIYITVGCDTIKDLKQDLDNVCALIMIVIIIYTTNMYVVYDCTVFVINAKLPFLVNYITVKGQLNFSLKVCQLFELLCLCGDSWSIKPVLALSDDSQ